MTKEQIIKIAKGVGLVLLGVLLLWGLIKLIGFIRVKTARIEVTLQSDLTVEFLSPKKLSDFIVSINGQILDDYDINTKKIGKQELKFEFKNDDGIKVPYAFTIEVVDTVEPIIWLNNSYTIYQGNDIDLVQNILCGDNEDNNPHCFIEGEYDYNTIGDYNLVFKAIDRSGNEANQPFTLHVLEPPQSTPNVNKEKSVTLFSDVVARYKNDHTKVGIDVSGWQGDIDFAALKSAGVEFMIIKVGGTKGTEGEYYVDSKFIDNITKANQYGIDVGVYFYSYANSKRLAKEDAKWLLKQIEPYQVTLPIAFDWENWSKFNEYNLSFFDLTEMATTFLDTVTKNGYQGMLYSSKTYLERLWLPMEYDTWLAHYTTKTNYQGKYSYWQLCDDGQVDGINGAVDIDIMYLDEN